LLGGLQLRNTAGVGHNLFLLLLQLLCECLVGGVHLRNQLLLAGHLTLLLLQLLLQALDRRLQLLNPANCIRQVLCLFRQLLLKRFLDFRKLGIGLLLIGKRLLLLFGLPVQLLLDGAQIFDFGFVCNNFLRLLRQSECKLILVSPQLGYGAVLGG